MKKLLSRENILQVLFPINFLIFVAAAIHLTFFDMSAFNAKTIQISSIADFGIVILCLIFFGMKKIDLSVDENFWFIIFISTLNLFLFSFNAGIFTLELGKNFNAWSMFFLSAGYFFGGLACYPVYIFSVKMFGKNLSDNPREFKILNIACVIGFIALIGNIFFGYYFAFDEDGNFSVTGAGDMIFSAICFILTIKFIWQQKTTLTKKFFITAWLIFVFFSGFFMNEEGALWSLATSTCFVIFIYSELYKKREIKFAEQQTELLQTELKSLHLQMNPHFIYNTLASIAGLCYENPKSAENMIVKFSNYLRDNFTEMNKKVVRTFEEEILHIEEYFAIEKIRFPNIEIFYELSAKDFNLPSMTIQPLVENAIVHGICKRRKARGKIFIKSYEDAENFFIEVKDDGVGFKNFVENEKHVGLKNVRLRLKILFNGSLEIKSIPGLGTICEVKIPKKVS